MIKRSVKVARPLFPNRGRLLKRFEDILTTGRLMNGQYAGRFEAMFAEKTQVRHAISVNSCTTALEVVLRYLNVGGGEVIVPTNTFVATANAVVFAGGVPVFADIKDQSYCLDPEEVLRLLNRKTRAVVAVHIAGLVAPEVASIAEICREKRIPLVEDCAHAVGASFAGKSAGTFGVAGCFSFYPTKVITTGTGGMITTNDDGLFRYARSVRVHGAGDGLTDIVNVGNDWLLDEFRCAVGVSQMESLDVFLKKRRAVAAVYDALLVSEERLLKYPVHRGCLHAYYKYPVQVQAKVDVRELKRIFPEKYGMELESVYWPVCHLQPVYRRKCGYRKGGYPTAEAVLSRQIALPIHAAMTKEDAVYVVECLQAELDHAVR